MSDAPANPQQLIQQFQDDFNAVQQRIASVIVGQDDAIRSTLTALFGGGHVLLEGLPGSGKTLLARSVADALELTYRRIQFTPDLMPADVIGTYVVLESAGRRKFEFQQGPIFTQLLLADEVNRSTPKTQAALLEGLEEWSVTVANETYSLPDPFFAIATQSPGDPEGTFPLPEVQTDRFFYKVFLKTPSSKDLETILERTTESQEKVATKVINAARVVEMTALVREVTIAPQLRQYAVELMLATHPDQPNATPMVKKFVEHGSSTRGAQAMVLGGKVNAILAGRAHASGADILQAALPSLRHRLVLNYEGQGEGISPDQILEEVLRSVSQP